MDTQHTDSPRPVTTEDLMAYLDGELSPEQRQRVERGLSSSTELQRELAMYQAMKTDIQGLHFQAPHDRSSVWDQVNRRLSRPIGWGLLIAGLVVWMTYGTYLFATSSVSRWEKLGTGAVAIGVLMLLASVIYERVQELQTDPYRHVQR
jgi:hypothetical protein